MRLIDADALIEFCAERWIPLNIDAVNMQPTIQPVATDICVGDTISRQAAIDELPYLLDYDGLKGENGFVSKRLVRKMLKELPPAQPEPHEGHWILHESPDGGEQYECSRCGVLWEFTGGTSEDNEAYFCPKCGTKMKGEQNEL